MDRKEEGMCKMTFLDFFAGVGGFRRGMELAGHKCVGFCEVDKYAVASYTSMHLITDEQREYLNTLDFKKRQKEILKEEYRNGEWYCDDVRRLRADDVPRADVYCFGFPCQDISVAGKQLGFAGHRSSLFFAVTRVIRDLEEKDRPSVLFIENVKNLLSVNRGFDFAKLLVELDEVGYDCEWSTLNSKHFGVPQNRERVFIIGHLRGRSRREVFPVEGTNGENRVSVNQIGRCPGTNRDNPNQYRVYDTEGISPTLSKMDGGGREPHIVQPEVIGGIGEKNFGKQWRQGNRIYDGLSIATALESSPVGNTGGFSNLYSVPIILDKNAVGEEKEVANTKQTGTAVAIPVLTPDRARIRQSGRRFKEDGEPMFTLTGQDKHGVMVSNANKSIAAVWSDKYQCYIAIRKLTPKECFRLQGWTDDYFEKAEFVNSNSQLYKQAGNGVTVNVIYEIAKKL